MDRADYRDGWKWKQQWYGQNNFAEGRNLFTSTEEQIRDVNFIDKMAKTIQAALDSRRSTPRERSEGSEQKGRFGWRVN
jgi:hypothetical protein